MKKKVSLTIICGTALLTGVAAVSSSLAWFTSTAFVKKEENPFGATVEDAYYAYGLGTEQSPFGITRPRHLYNLAWLQYLGFYNKAADHQYYFELGADIDMTGYSALPPIGTELNPFVGRFNGQGYSINSLTVSNDFDDYTIHPAAVSSFDNNTKKQPHILGLFGVVGEYTNGHIQNSYSSAINELIDIGIRDITVKSVMPDSLVGLAAGYVNGTMSNVAVESGTIDMNEEAIGETETSSYGGFTQNISDYTVVGYTANKTTIKKITDTAYNINVQTGQEFTSNLQGDNLGFGGSIDMNSVFKRLTNLHGLGSDVNQTVNNQTNPDAIFSTTYTHHERGDDTPTNTFGRYHQYVGNTGTGNNADYRGFIKWSRDGTDTAKKHYLLGGKYEIHNYYDEYDTLDGYRITDGDGNYLTFNGTNNSAPANSTDANSHVWEFQTTANDGSGYIRTLYEDTYYYLMNVTNNLRIQNVADSNNATKWKITINDNDLDIFAPNSTRKILYNNNSWGLYQEDEEVTTNYSSLTNAAQARYFPISILNGATNSLASVTDYSQVKFDTPTNNGQVTFKYNGQTYGLYATTGTGYNFTASVNNPGGNYRALNYVSSGPYVRTSQFTSNRNNYYIFLYLNGTNWASTRVRTNASFTDYVINFVSHSSTETPYLNLHLSNTLATSTNFYRERFDEARSYERPVFSSDDTTYMPIIAYDQGDDVGLPKKNNTGYFVAGMTNDEYSQNQDDIPRSIIVSQYDFRDNSNNNNTSVRIAKSFSIAQKKFIDSEVYTIDNDSIGAVTANNRLTKFKKYDDSKAGLTSVLNGTVNNNVGKVGGFHFFARDSQFSVNKNYVVNAKNVLINGEKKDTFQLPVYSLDFHLKDQGFVNFFAAMYNGNDTGAGSTGNNHMNGFFSLHKVIRDEDTEEIEDIREIKAIFKKTALDGTFEYVLLYKNESDTLIVDEEGQLVSSNPTNFNPATYASNNSLEFCFDTDWILYRDLDDYSGRVFYFEIPLDPGEYCLGGYNVPSGVNLMDGAYLMYLDIGAGSARIKRTAIAEHFIESAFVVSYPNGVALIPTSSISGETKTFDSSDSVCVVIKATYVGTLVVTRDSNNNVTVARAADYDSVSKPSYISDTIQSVVDPGDSSNVNDDVDLINDFFCNTKEVKETYRIQYYDYNVNLKTLTKTIIEDTKSGTLTNAVPNSVSSNAPVTLGNFARKITQIEPNGDVYTMNSQSDIDSSNVLVYKYFGEDSEEHPNPDAKDNGRVWTTYSEVMAESAQLYYYIAENAEVGTMYTVSGICSTLDEEILSLKFIYADTITVNMTYDLAMTFVAETMIYPELDYYVVIPLVRYVGTSTGETVEFVIVSIDEDIIVYFFDGNTILVNGKYVYEITDSVEPIDSGDEIIISPIVNPAP